MTVRIALVYPRFRYRSGDPPLGVASLAAVLRAAGHEVAIVDTTFHPDDDWLRKRLADSRPEWVGCYVDTPGYRDALRVGRYARELGAATVAGGPHATVLPETLTEHFDQVVVGEGEVTLPALLAAGGGAVPGAVRRGGELVPREPIADLDALPLPALDLLEMDAYLRHWHYLDALAPDLPGTTLLGSRGCPFQCSYCQPTLRRLFGDRVRRRSPAGIVRELAHWRGRYPLRGFFFHDDTLTADRNWCRALAAALRDAGDPLPWGCNVRADTVDAELLAELHRAGLRVVHLGIESGSRRVREEIYRKPVSDAAIAAAVDAARRTGIRVLGFFMLGAPTETRAEIEATLRLARDLPLTEATFNLATPFPGTGLAEEIRAGRFPGYRLHPDYGRYDYYSGGSCRRPDLSAAELKYHQWRGLLGFYLRPRRWGYLGRHLLSPAGRRRLANKVRRFA